MRRYKTWFDRDSLRQKVLRWALVPMVILLLLNIALFYKFGHDSADRRHDRFLLDTSKILLDQLRTEQGEVTFSIHSGALSMLDADTKDQVFYSLSGVRHEYRFGYPDLPAPPEGLSTTPSYYLAEYEGHQVRMMAAIMPESDVPEGKVVVMLAKTLKLHHERAQEWVWRILPAQLALLLFAGVAVWGGVRRGMRPLLHMRDEVAGRSSQDLRPLDEEKVVTEVRPLIHGFNQLLGRLSESMDLQQRFIADAAHQLRTPLAGLKVQTELAMRLDDPEEIRHSLQQMLKATEQTVHLAQQLLALARAEPGAQSRSSMHGFDLVAMARSVTTNWVQVALQKNIDLGFEAESDARCVLLGNRFLLAEALGNLIDNALRYTPANGCVTVRVSCDDEHSIVEVEDNGIGIPENQRERVFERFYRVLGSDQTGCGLGLSIVREIVTFHGGVVSISGGAQGVGSLFRFGFPTQKREART